MNISVKELAKRYKYFLLDCDGVMWHGQEVIGNSFRNVEYLEDLGCKVYFVTNLAAVSRKALASKMMGSPFNYKVDLNRLYPASTLAGLWVK